jgi:hypothetical protein
MNIIKGFMFYIYIYIYIYIERERERERERELIKNIRKQTATENGRMGTRVKAKKGKTQREMDRWSKTEHDKPWTGRRGY